MELKDIALAQLRAAAQMYNEENYVCAITLAGASEEIFGQMAKKRRGRNQLDLEVAMHKSVFQLYNRPQPSDKEAKAWINRLKNTLKHNDAGENPWVDPMFFEDEAASLIIRAAKNYFNSYGELPRDRIVKRLFIHLTL